MNMRYCVTIARVAAVAGVFVMSAGLGATDAAAPQTGQAGAPSGQALPLTMDQAVAMALEANLGLKSERMNLDLASHSIALARSAFLPQVQTSLGRRASKAVPFGFTHGLSAL